MNKITKPDVITDQDKENVKKLCSNLGLDFNKIKNIQYFIHAFTHSTYANENRNTSSYDYLEFLGDSIIQFTVSEYIFSNYRIKEGKATTVRASVVKTESLYLISQKLGLIDFLRASRGATTLKEAKKVYADLFESMMAAVYLNFGMKAVKKIGQELLFPLVDKYILVETKDPKTLLQEYLQSSEQRVSYDIKEIDGGYKAIAISNNKSYGVGYGKNKKEAEENAAIDALKSLGV